MAITITEKRVQDQSSAFNIEDIINVVYPDPDQQLLNELKIYLASTKANSESATASESAAKSYATAADASAQSATTSANNAIAAEKSAKESENQVKNAITEANYQLLYLENGRLMLYKSDATSNDLDFRIKDHKNLEVTFL